MSPEELQQKTYEIELDKFAFEKQKLKSTEELENRKLSLERRKAIWTAISVVVAALSILGSVIVGTGNIVESARLQNQATDTQFALKAAEIVLQSDDPSINQDKAARFQELYPNRVPKDWAKNFDWKKHASENYDMKREVAKLLAEHPERSKQIIENYQKLFYDDSYVLDFLARLKPTTSSK
jgi:hypothetical protein